MYVRVSAGRVVCKGKTSNRTQPTTTGERFLNVFSLTCLTTYIGIIHLYVHVYISM